MAEKLRVYNTKKFNIGIKTPDNLLGINIRPGSFTMLDSNEIEYLMSTCTLFQKGWLQVEEKAREETLAKMGIDENEESAFMPDDEIRKKLNGSAKNLEKWLNTVTDPVELDRIADLAIESNLSVAKIKVIQARIPHRDLMDE